MVGQHKLVLLILPDTKDTYLLATTLEQKGYSVQKDAGISDIQTLSDRDPLVVIDDRVAEAKAIALAAHDENARVLWLSGTGKERSHIYTKVIARPDNLEEIVDNIKSLVDPAPNDTGESHMLLHYAAPQEEGLL